MTNPPHRLHSGPSLAAHRINHHAHHAIKIRTPTLSDDGAMSHSNANNAGEGSENMGEEDATLLEFRDRYARTEVRLMALLGRDAENASAHASSSNGQPIVDVVAAVEDSQPASAPKKAARAIDEDDYGDDDDDEEEEDVAQQSPLKGKGGAVPVAINGITSTALQIPPMARKPSIERQASASSTDKNKTAEDVRKELEQDKRAREDAARESFRTLLYTLESDRDAMLEQQKLEELDRQVEKEMAGQNNGSVNQPSTTAAPLGTLSSTNLGASSLTLKHLIARIDAKRNEVHASDQHLRSLMSEVRKNRSKWASEDMVGQEELYEAAEKVLFELKAMTEYAGPFLVRVQKREAPDYYNIIKHPMDIGTMLKKLKGYQYKSKKDFVDDLNLIWANCLKYNTDPNHPIRKKALYMRKETEKLVPLIPDIVVKTRAEVEAEERRQQNADADGEAVEDSDDEEPIMASRGRKAPSKSNKGTNNARKAPPALAEGTPGAETKPTVPHLKDSASNLRTEFLRADSDAPMDGSQNGLTTPPPGTLTPLGPHGIFSSGAPGSQVDPSEGEAGASASGAVVAYEDADIDDLEYKTWKQVTKKDRALMASERNRLFRGDKLNVDEPAILRSRAGMRRWIRQQKVEDTALDGMETQSDGKAGVQTSTETLAEGIQGEDERQLPDYYDPVSAIPNLQERLRWVEDAEGQVIFQSEEFLRIKPKAQFVAPSSGLTKKMDANMKQMQETRKVCAKIGVVKQMQLQAQMYQNQFQKYEPTPLQETDVGDVVTSDDGPIMSQWTCRAALQRSVGKIFYHAGFEDFQPAALDTVTDIAGQYFHNLVRTLQSYRETPKIQSANLDSSWHLKFTAEESILHGLLENGIDVESLESYVKDDMDRMGSKLGIMQERMKAHLAELLRPALDPNAGEGGVGAFNDGSEQFVGGDFAEEIGEDFFGFKELGLDREFSMASLGVPLHLLQNRMHNQYQAQNASAISTTGLIMEQPPPFERITVHNVGQQIGLIQEFLRQKLLDNNNEALIEDEELPAKQRPPKPRLPPNGKITSPRKRPLKEQQQMARKKRKLDAEGKEDATAGVSNGSNLPNGVTKGMPKPIGKLKLDVPASAKENAPAFEPEKDDSSAVGIPSPESIAA